MKRVGLSCAASAGLTADLSAWHYRTLLRQPPEGFATREISLRFHLRLLSPFGKGGIFSSSQQTIPVLQNAHVMPFVPRNDVSQRPRADGLSVGGPTAGQRSYVQPTQ